MNFIDTHAHYNDEVYKDNLEEILRLIKSENIDKVVNVSYDYDSMKKSLELSKKYDWISTSIGFHPHDVEKFDIKIIEDIFKENKKYIVAIGEIGLDYAYTKDNKNKQKEIFIEQINFAKKNMLPIIIHSRDASKDTCDVVRNNLQKDYKVLFHCFSPTDELVNIVLENNYFVAFGGNITYPRNKSFYKYIEMIPLEQIVIETDCPYLSPIPFRGQINNSSNLKYILKTLADIKKIDENKLSEIIYQNSLRFFNLT
jgi:TatD DNase family protein